MPITTDSDVLKREFGSSINQARDGNQPYQIIVFTEILAKIEDTRF